MFLKGAEIFFKNLISRILFGLRKSKYKPGTLELNKNSKVLCIRLNRAGDALVSTPFILLLQRSTGCTIDVLADKFNSFVFENNPSIRNIHKFRKSSSGIKEVVSLIKQEKYDVIIDLHDDVSSTVSLILSKVKGTEIAGTKKKYYKLYTKLVDRLDPQKYHIIDRTLEIGKIFGLNASDLRPVINSTGEEKIIVDKFLKDNNLNGYLIAVNISAGSNARFWGVNNFKRLLNKLNEFDVKIILLASPNEIDIANEISEGNFPVSAEPTFGGLAEIISRVNLVFTPDTSVVHLASAFNIPVFGIYVHYNTSDMIWSPYNTEFDCVITKEPTLHNMDYNEVEQKFIKFLNQRLKNETST
ncbi:MAG: glycosyltransferase family 9 protein [Ignavibacteriaceae bacterium]|nr:glycosyltransferase family 9 protein [Ignavibacteriaceae bacterium]